MADDNFNTPVEKVAFKTKREVAATLEPEPAMRPAEQQNYTFSTEQQYSEGNYMFRVEIDGKYASFHECTGLGSSVEVIQYSNGADQRMRKYPGKASYSDVKLKWGAPGDVTTPEIYEWHREILNGNLVLKNVAIVLTDRNGVTIERWVLYRAWPSAYEGPSLNAMGTGAAVESITLVCERMEKANDRP